MEIPCHYISMTSSRDLIEIIQTIKINEIIAYM